MEYAEIPRSDSALVQLILFGVDRCPVRKRLEPAPDETGGWLIERGYEEAADEAVVLSCDATTAPSCDLDAGVVIGSWRDA